MIVVNPGSCFTDGRNTLKRVDIHQQEAVVRDYRPCYHGNQMEFLWKVELGLSVKFGNLQAPALNLG